MQTQTPTPETPSSNRRIAKNALALYARMLLTMLVGFYTSRVVLNVLGVSDYGIYGVVGGVVAMLGFLNASMSGATSRFLTFELGRGDQQRLARTFSSALIIHVGIALVVLVLSETVGLWFMLHKLVIPPERMGAAQWVYQLSILSAMLSITQAPYNASIIAHERMNVYAYVEILNSVLKLLIVYLLTIGHYDKLILYAWLILGVSVLIIAIYRIYCLRHFAECRFHWIWDKSILRPLLSFSGWNIYGNFGSVVGQQGTNFVINNFFGVVMNTAANLGLTVANVVNAFASNIITAFRPQITISYSQGNIEQMQRLTLLAIKVIMTFFAIVAIPTIIEADNLLAIWLVKVPDYTAVFCRLMIASIFFELLRYIIIMDIHASGNVKLISFSTGTFMTLVPAIVYVLYRLGCAPEFAFVTFIVANALLALLNVYLAKHYIPQISARAYLFTIFQVVTICATSLVASWLIVERMQANFFRLICTFCISLALTSALCYVFVLNKWQRQWCIDKIKTKLHIK